MTLRPRYYGLEVPYSPPLSPEWSPYTPSSSETSIDSPAEICGSKNTIHLEEGRTTSDSTINKRMYAREPDASRKTAPKIDWIDVLALSGKDGRKGRPAPEEYWRLYLEQTLRFWDSGRLGTVERYCDYALARPGEMSLFFTLFFMVIQHCVSYDAVEEVIIVLDMYLEIGRSNTHFTISECDGIAWLRQIAGKAYMKDEMRACLGMKTFDANVSPSLEERKREHDDALKNLRRRIDITDVVHCNGRASAH